MHPSAQRPIVSILIVNFNGRQVLDDCLRTIEERLDLPHEVIVCDNGSTDGGIAHLREAFPRVRFIEHPVNAGFAAGCNLAAAAAEGEFLLLLNNDTKLTGDLAVWIDLLRHDATIGVAGCRLSNASGVLQESIGQRVTLWRLWTMWLPIPSGWSPIRTLRLVVSRQDPRYDAPIVEVPWVCGAALLTRKTLWEALGGMDSRYFMYFEDVDYCERARRRGYRVIYSASAAITHLMGGGKRWAGPLSVQRFVDSLVRYGRRRFGVAASPILRGVVPLLLLVRSGAYAITAGARARTHRREQAVAHLKVAYRIATAADRHGPA